MCLRMHITPVKPCMRVQKMAKFKSDFKQLSVCLSTILEFHNKMVLISGPTLRWPLSQNIFEILQDLTVAEIQ